MGDDIDRLTGKPYRATGASSRGTGALGPWPSTPPTLVEGFLQIEQEAAVRLADALLPHFAAAFAVGGSPVSSHMTRRPSISVLGPAEFQDLQARVTVEQWEETYQYRFKYARDVFERRFMETRDRRASPGGGSGRLSKVIADDVASPLVGSYKGVPRSFAELRRDDAAVLFPPAAVGNAAGFWHAASNTVYVKAGKVNGGTVSHELCHSYAAREWNTVQLILDAWGQGKRASYLDEGITAELADLVIEKWIPRPPISMTGTRRRTDAPSGFGGYGAAEKAMARAFLHVAEHDVRPREVTMRAYFAGKVSVAVDRKTPEKSKISAGGATVVLSDLVANARSMRADLDPSWKGDIK